MAEERRTPESSIPKGGGALPANAGDTKSEQRGALAPGTIYDGRIIAVGDNLFSVEVEGSSQIITNVHCAVGICTGLFGYRTYVFWELGDWVKVSYGTESFIVGASSRDNPDLDNPNSRSHTGFGLDASTEPAGPYRRRTPVNDLVSGEFEIANLLGMALVMATNFISLKAGDRAKVEVGLLGGLVRVVSAHFKHHSAFGDMEIFDDGRLNMILEGTSYPWEADGKLTRNEEGLIALKGNQVDMEAKDFTESMRSRFCSYVGWLGDMVRLFVTDPTAAANQIGQQAFRAGRATFWTGTNGDMLLSSVGEIAVEHVHKILVPRRNKRQEDKSGNTPKDYDDSSAMSPELLKPWKVDPNDLCASMFQLREYARWFSQVHALRRFRQAAKDWDVPTEATSPIPDPAAREEDVERAGGGVEVIVLYATIRIMRDGSIVGRNGYGASIAMAGEDLYLNAPRNLYLEAGGDVQVTAGRDFLVKSRRSIEMVAVRGGIIFYAKTWFRAFCEWGSFWIRSGAEDPSKPGVTLPTPEEGDPVPEILPHAIFLETTKGRTLVRSKRQARVQTYGKPDSTDDTDTTANVVLDATGSVASKGVRNLVLQATSGFASLSSGKDMRIAAGKALYFQATLVDFFSTLTFAKGQWNFLSPLVALVVKARSLSGGKCGFTVPLGSRHGVGPHFNHVLTLPQDYTVPAPSEEDMAAAATIRELVASSFPQVFSGQGPLWGFCLPVVYRMAGAKRYESHAQQALYEDTPAHYATWSWAEDTAAGPGIDPRRRQPWGATYLFHRHRGGTPFKEDAAGIPGRAPTAWSSGESVFLYYKQDPT